VKTSSCCVPLIRLRSGVQPEYACARRTSRALPLNVLTSVHTGENVQLLRSARPTPLRRTPEYAYARQTSRALHLNVLTSVRERFLIG
jgi:hypothetical protein